MPIGPAPVRIKDTWNPKPASNLQVVLTPDQLDQIEELSVFHCPESEIAHAIGVSHAMFISLKRRQEEVLRRITVGQSKGKRALRSVQFKVALQGNVNMLMYLGRVILNQCPDLPLNAGGGTFNEPGDLSPAAKAHLAELAQSITQVALNPKSHGPTREIEAEVRLEIPSPQPQEGEEAPPTPTQTFDPHTITVPGDPVKYFTEPPVPIPTVPTVPQPEYDPFDKNLFDSLLEDAKQRSASDKELTPVNPQTQPNPQ